jgi:hypothetical protein
LFARLIGKGFLLVVCWLLSVPQQWRDFVDIKVLRRHLRHTVVKESVDLGTNVAIVATWARIPLRHSVQRLLDALRAEGWSIILVLNESPDVDHVMEDWSAPADVVIRRANLGRDFAAYQCGYRYLQKRVEFQGINRLALFNDSVLYPPAFGSILPELLQKEIALSGFFINFQFHNHVQSFGLVLGRSIATSAKIVSFWSSYYPSNIRRYAINDGEVELTRQVTRSWPETAAVVTYERLLSEDADLWSRLSVAETQTLLAGVEGNSRYEYRTRRRMRIRAEELDLLAREAFASRNTSHVLGLLATRVLSVPLKLDQLRQGICTPADFAETLDRINLDPDERAEVMAMLEAQGTYASASFIQRQMRITGFGG